jgi:transketolase
MLNQSLKLNPDIFLKENMKATREGFGEGLVDAGNLKKEVVVICGDLTDSTCVNKFADSFPNRYIQTGIAEQNMMAIAAGLALNGKTPFVAGYASFGPARGWDQIRVAICYTKANVKIVGSHAGFSACFDGATAQALEDIAIMRVLPYTIVIDPIDAVQAAKATIATAMIDGPVYLRLAREKTPIITTDKTPFEIGKAYVMNEGKDITIISSGPITYEVLLAARNLEAKHKIFAEVIASPTIKPLDEEIILESAKKTKRVITVEEHQIIGGLGGAVCELLSEKLQVPVTRMGTDNTFGESGSYNDLLNKFGLSAHHIEEKVINFLKTN